MAYRIVKWAMAAAAVLYVALVLLLPAAAGLRGDVFAWFLYGAYVLITVMVWAIGGKATRNVGQGNYDAVLVSDFDSLEDLAAYKADPRHQAVSALCKSIRTDRAAVDYEY